MIPEHSRDLPVFAEFPEMNPGPVCRLDRSGRVVLANTVARRLFGEGELQGKVWQELCPGLSESLWLSILNSTEPVQHEADFGDHCVLFTHVRASSGETLFVFGSDVTTLRKMELKLAELARFPEMNPGPVLKMDLRGSILLANASARQILNENITGQSWLEICPGMTPALWRSIHDTADPVLLEAQVKGCIFVFTHRCDPLTKVVFVFGADITKQKHAEKALRQSEKLATLGTLAAGIAHELNNPAAATCRAADHLRDAVARLEGALYTLDTDKLSPRAREELQTLKERAKEYAIRRNDLDPLSQSDLESAVEDWLDDQAVPQPWEVAPALAALDFTPADMSELESVFAGGNLLAVLQWVASAFVVYRLLHEITEGSERISEIVNAMKGYSYVGQAPLRMIDIHAGLDNTLVILRNKLKEGIIVKREYQQGVPNIVAYGSELNQVWTHLLDNAADALDGKGEITIRTKVDGGWVVVEISDDGPGIPESIQARIFDPFFTTKEPGRGTGLGLSTAYSIIRDMHKGEISLVSQPGSTHFTVKLPIDNPDLGRDLEYEQTVSRKG